MKTSAQCKREAPKLYWVLWRVDGKLKEFHTNDLDTAEKKAAINEGTIYVDNRHKARLRLYWFLLRKELYPPL